MISQFQNRVKFYAETFFIGSIPAIKLDFLSTMEVDEGVLELADVEEGLGLHQEAASRVPVHGDDDVSGLDSVGPVAQLQVALGSCRQRHLTIIGIFYRMLGPITV